MVTQKTLKIAVYPSFYNKRGILKPPHVSIVHTEAYTDVARLRELVNKFKKLYGPDNFVTYYLY